MKCSIGFGYCLVLGLRFYVHYSTTLMSAEELNEKMNVACNEMEKSLMKSLVPLSIVSLLKILFLKFT